MRKKRIGYKQPLYYVEVYQNNVYDSCQFFDRYSSAMDFGRTQVSKLDNASVYYTVYDITYTKNGRFTLSPRHVGQRTKIYL